MTSGDEFRVELKMTGDGSPTLFVPALNEHYHSVFGAIAESRHIFINAGFNFIKDKDGINILEIGFGTGLNVFLTWLEVRARKVKVNYTAIEKYLLKPEVYSTLNYPDLTGYSFEKEYFIKMHELSWNSPGEISDGFFLHKIHTSLEEYHPEKDCFDLVYFDAFGPDVQPEMWSLQVFQKMAATLKRGGALVTYSTKGTVKRNLKEAGFSIEKLPGPAGKREVLRACLQTGD